MKLIKCLCFVCTLIVFVGSPIFAAEKLVVSTWGFNMDKIEEYLKHPFEEKYGVEIIYVLGNNSDRLAKLEVAKENPNVDVIHLADYFMQIAINRGLIAEMDASQIPNIDRLYDFSKYPLGEKYGPAFTLYNFGIVYREDRTDNPVTSWKDLWREEFKDFVALPIIENTQGPATVMMTGLAWGDGPKDEETAFTKLEELKENVIKFTTRGSELVSLFQRDEVWISVTIRLVLGNLLNTGLPIKWVNPKEGSFVMQNLICLVKGTKKADLAYKYIDFALSDEVQTKMAMSLVDSPTNKYVEVPEDVALRLTYGKDIAGLMVQDLPWLLTVRDAWVERYNRHVMQ